MVWDSQRGRAVLFGGMREDQLGDDPSFTLGMPLQDTWEWDPATPGWTERTAVGNKPNARYGHAMAYDPSRGVTVLAGGFDIGTGDGLADLWEWDPATATWAQRLDGSEANLPSGRLYASLVADSARSRLVLLAGVTLSPPSLAPISFADVWDLEPAAEAFTNRTPPSSQNTWPPRRSGHAMAFCPATGRMYVFGGADQTGAPLDDLWEWDGSTWSQVQSDVRPAPRWDTAMAYDPVRKSLILFGGVGNPPLPYADANGYLRDTWEWQSSTRKWGQLFPASGPDAVSMHGMVTDSGRAKVLLYGGQNNSLNSLPGSPTSPIAASTLVWEWDGGKVTWTNHTPVVVSNAQYYCQTPPLLSFDDSRQKMFLFTSSVSDDEMSSGSSFSEWDPVTAGWTYQDPGDLLNFSSSYGGGSFVAYDSLRRRQVLTAWTSDAVNLEVYELDPRGPTWYLRTPSTGPSSRSGSTIAFDSGRGVMVLFGGAPDQSSSSSETWEYKVTKLGNGEGCTAATASTCASGFCVENVCCAVASCSGACQSCSVAGYEGTCVRAAAGTQVPGSCSDGQACDGSGKCKSKNGAACGSASACASGFCTDGVCCESACDGTCESCNQAARAGQCSPHAVGSDPEGECDSGSDPCRSTCDGTGSCDYPEWGTPCGPCEQCDGAGICTPSTPFTCGPVDSGSAGSGGAGGTGGTGAGGTGGTGAGGAGGSAGSISGGAGGRGGTGGASDNPDGGRDANATDAGRADGASDSVSPDAGSPASARDSSRLDAGGADGARDAIPPDLASPDGANDSSAPDARSPDVGLDAIASDASNPARLGHSGCDCDLGKTAPRTPGLPLAMLGTALLWRRLRRRQMQTSAVVALLLLVACSENNPDDRHGTESSQLALGTVPATESATWTRVDVPATPTPDSRYLQTAAFDEVRNMLVMFGGQSGVDATGYQPAAS
jgi:hypothetical protein